jgi:hypothetical protein
MATYKELKTRINIGDIDIREMANEAAKREDMPVTSFCSRILRERLKSILSNLDGQGQAKTA